MAYVLTADGGTESLRARVYDLAGKELSSVALAYETKFSAGARAEQDPADWWKNFVSASRGAIAEAGIDPAEIDAICFDTTCCSVVALDENGNALRPALIWMDVRANAEADAVLATGDPALCLNGNGAGPVSAEWMIPKSLWIKRNEPAIYDKAYRICEYQDYITYQLTGEWAASLDNAGLRWHYRNDAGGWAASLVTALGMEAMLEKWPPRMAAPGELIGTLTAKAAAGASVIVADMDLREAEKTAAALGGSAIALDVTDAAAVEAAAAGLEALDILVNNAGIVHNGPSTEIGIADWQRVIDVNLSGVFRTARAFGRAMVARGQGSVISTSSICGQVPVWPQPQAAYNAAKAGVNLVTKSLAVEWAASGVRVNAVAPGYTATELTLAGRSKPEWYNVWLERTPMGRLADPDEIASAAVFLASDAASYITGTVLTVDGGYTAL